MTSYYRALFFSLTSLLAVGGTLGSCQRAGYAFQPSASVAALAVAVEPPAVVQAGAVLPIVGPAPAAVAAVRRQMAPPAVLRPLPAKPAARRVRRIPYRAAASQLVRREVARRVPAVLSRRLVAEGPVATPANKWVAVALAVLLGFLGVHLFYLGRRRRAWAYLGATLLCAALAALLLAALPAATLGAGLMVVFLVLMALGGIGVVYAYALMDALRMLVYGVDSV